MKKIILVGVLFGFAWGMPQILKAQDENSTDSFWHIFSDIYYETGWVSKVTLPGEPSLNAPGQNGFGIDFFSDNPQDFHLESGFQFRRVDLKGFNVPSLVEEDLFEARLGLRYYPLESTFGFARWTASLCANISIGSSVNVGPLFTTGFSIGDDHYRSINLLLEFILRPLSLNEELQNVSNGSGTPSAPLSLGPAFSLRIGLLLG